jgi:hypothetical protein
MDVYDTYDCLVKALAEPGRFPEDAAAALHDLVEERGLQRRLLEDYEEADERTAAAKWACAWENIAFTAEEHRENLRRYNRAHAFQARLWYVLRHFLKECEHCQGCGTQTGDGPPLCPSCGGSGRLLSLKE